MTVSVETDGAWVEVVVAEDGVGLAAPAVPRAGPGFGLHFTQERAAAAGGSLAIASCPSEGTRVTVCVPRREGPSEPRALPEDVPAGRGGG